MGMDHVRIRGAAPSRSRSAPSATVRKADSEQMMSASGERLERALASLAGLSVGDAFGEQFFARPDDAAARRVPDGLWPYTDDTQMALSVVAVLARRGHIDQDELARSFAAHYEPFRGYGP